MDPHVPQYQSGYPVQYPQYTTAPTSQDNVHQEKGPAAFAQPVAYQQDPHTSYQPMAPTSQWSPGFWKRFPLPGISSMMGTLLAIIMMVVVLVTSHGKPVDQWKVQPAVLLAIASAIANNLARFALAESLDIAWWVKASRPGTKIADLHNVWAFGTQLWPAITAGGAFNFIALTSVLLSIIPINGPLLQRASEVTTSPVAAQVFLKVPIAQQYPQGYTGWQTGRTSQIAFVTTNFSTALSSYTNRVPLNVTDVGCKGTCTGVLRGAGYAIDCTSSTTPFNQTGTVTRPQEGGTLVFNTEFKYIEGYAASFPLNYSTTFKTTEECVGDLQVRKCTLRPAVVEYQVLMNNNSISLNPSSSYKDDKVVQFLKEIPATPSTPGGSTHGGIGLVLGSMFNSVAYLQFSGTVGYTFNSTGVPAFQFADKGLTDAQKCTNTWTDPTDNMMNTARDLAFRTAIVAGDRANASHIQPLQFGLRIDNVPVYNSNFAFLGGALAVTFLALISIIPLFNGWWNLGRQTTLSPIEIAKAFNAPTLASSDSNAPAESLLKEIGSREIRYGAQTLGGPNRSGSSSPEKLLMDDPAAVHEPALGKVFVG